MQKHKLSPYLLVLTTLVILFLVFGNVISSPNDYLFALGGDGMKNYYTPAYYMKYDSGRHFSGMNYPFGEHVIFTDQQYGITLVLKWIDRYIISLADNTIGIYNLLMLLSVVPCVFFLFLILRRCLLPDWYAFPIALIIGFLSPQWSRFIGHYALTYMCYVPLVWYLLVKTHHDQKTWVWAVLLGVVILAFGFIQPYYLLIGSAFVAAYGLVDCLQQGPLKFQNLRTFSLWLIIALFPIIIFKAWLSFTDPVTDRPEGPWGFFLFIASWRSVFLPTFGPLYDGLKNIMDMKQPEFEGLAYVGLTGTAVLCLSVIKIGGYLWRLRFARIFRPVLPDPLKTSIWCGFGILLLAMAYPFRFWPETLPDLIPAIKQFRSIGRFAWIFYYIFTVYSAYFLYVMFRAIRKQQSLGFWKYPAFAGLALLLGLWIFETGVYLNFHSLFKKNKEATRFTADNFTHNLEKAGVSADDFQAILAFPYFLIGSEKLSQLRGHESPAFAMSCSYQTGLPIIHGMLSRTSISQSFQLAQLLSPVYIEKKLLERLPDRRPLLLITGNSQLWPAEKALLRQADLLWQKERFKAYRLPLDAFGDSIRAYKAEFLANRDFWVQRDGFYSRDSTTDVYGQSFDQESYEAPLWSQGALYRKKGPIELLKAPMNFSRDSLHLELSIWVRAEPKHSGFPVIYYKQYDRSSKMVDQKALNPKISTEVYRDWLKVTHVFQLFRKENIVELVVTGQEIILDELLIRPVNTDIYYFSASELICNNYNLGRFPPSGN